MSSPNQALDDLTLLDGIGEARQAFLRESLHVHAYGDLAALSVHEIAAAFTAAGKPISHALIEQWITNAAAKAETIEQEVSTPEAETEDAEGEWEWLDKIFVVEFRVFRVGDAIKKREIRVNQARTTKKGNWLDNGTKGPIILSGEKLYPWMVQQLGEQAWPVSVQEAPAETPVADTPPPLATGVAVTQIRAFSAAEPEALLATAGAGELLELAGDEPIDLEAIVTVAEAVQISAETPLVAKFYGRGPTTTTPLGDAPARALEAASYAARLSRVTLVPEMERLSVIASVRTTPPRLGFLEVPLRPPLAG